MESKNTYTEPKMELVVSTKNDILTTSVPEIDAGEADLMNLQL